MRLLFAIAFVALTACDGGEEAHHEPEAKPDDHAKVEPAPKPEPAPQPAELEVWKLAEDANPALKDPSKAAATAPATYKVKLETTKGDVVIQVNREWAPNGADRFYNLVEIGYFDEIAFFRAVEGFMVQFGISGYPEVAGAWRQAQIPDDPVTQSNKRGRLTFATAGPNTRTTQLFINYKDNGMLDAQGFAPIGEVVEGMDVLDSVYKGYGDGPPRGRGPNQGMLQMKGNAYLKAQFAELDYIKKATLVK